MERPTKSPPRPQAARGARSGSALRLASTPAPKPGSLGAAGDPAAHSGAPRCPGYHHPRLSHKEAESARAGACAGPGWGGVPLSPASQTRGSRDATGLGHQFSGFPEPSLGAGRGYWGSLGLTGYSSKLGPPRDTTRVTLGTLGYYGKETSRGGDGDALAGPGSGHRLVHLTAGRAAIAELLRGIPIRSSRDLVCAFKEPGRTPRGTGALNSGASPLIVQTQFLYESAANRELWLDICG